MCNTTMYYKQLHAPICKNGICSKCSTTEECSVPNTICNNTSGTCVNTVNNLECCLFQNEDNCNNNSDVCLWWEGTFSYCIPNTY